MIKKVDPLEKPIKAVSREVALRIGKAAITKSEVSAKGIGSNTHNQTEVPVIPIVARRGQERFFGRVMIINKKIRQAAINSR